MKHAHLVVDEELLERTREVSGERTYSAAVSAAMREYVRQAQARRILELRGSGVWEGNLAEMRGDTSPGVKKRRRSRRRGPR